MNQNNYYSYTFKKFKTNSASWGKEYYNFINNLGFKYNCKDSPRNNYEIVYWRQHDRSIGLPYNFCR